MVGAIALESKAQQPSILFLSICPNGFIELEAVGFPVICQFVVREFTYGGSNFNFLNLFTLFNCIKIVQSYGYVGLWGLLSRAIVPTV